MAATATDVLIKYATTAGAAGDSTAGAAGTSLGKYVALTQVLTSLNGLFDDISGAENAALTSDYRLVFFHNNHATLTLFSVSVYLSSEVSGGASIAIGVDPTAASAKGSAAAQAVTIATETTAPAGVTFSSPTTDGAGISLGDIPAGSVRGIWVKRTAANNSALANDGVTLGFAQDTPA